MCSTRSKTFSPRRGQSAQLYSLRELERQGLGRISRMPVSLRIVLESVLRNCDGKKIRESDVRALASWQKNAERTEEIPFVVARVLLQDFTGVPLLVDLAAMRSAMRAPARSPRIDRAAGAGRSGDRSLRAGGLSPARSTPSG
jgi:aconitate hydratase